MQKPNKGRKVALVAGLALVVLSVAVVWTYWAEIRFSLKFGALGRNAQGHPEYRHRPTGIVFVAVPGGTFDMGSPETESDREEDEGPVHKVMLNPFLIAKYEVTRAQWKKAGSNPARFKGDTLPVERVSWEDCQEFCEKTGLSLPTEAQWEYACRAGTDGPSGGTTRSVGEKLPNGFGLHDMHRNVWECRPPSRFDFHPPDRYGRFGFRPAWSSP